MTCYIVAGLSELGCLIIGLTTSAKAGVGTLVPL